jgi:hypothetical protein
MFKYPARKHEDSSQGKNSLLEVVVTYQRIEFLVDKLHVYGLTEH